MQVRVTVDPTGRMGLGLLLTMAIDAGAGTVIEFTQLYIEGAQFNSIASTYIQELKNESL